MIRIKRIFLFALPLWLVALAASAQSYSVDWHKVAGGGGTSTGGTFSLSGTIGQPDASATLAGGGYSVTGGFWSLIATVPVAGTPNLTIHYVRPNTVVVSWPNTGSYSLEQKSNLPGGNWTASPYPVTTANGTSSITITPPTGSLFFRLAQ